MKRLSCAVTIFLLALASHASDYKIYIDPGHFVGDKRTDLEIETNLAVALKLKHLLENDTYSGVTWDVKMARDDSQVYAKFPKDRANQANSLDPQPDLYLSIHCNGTKDNSGKATGTATFWCDYNVGTAGNYVLNPDRDQDKYLAQLVQALMAVWGEFKNIAVAEDFTWMIDEQGNPYHTAILSITEAPACLSEIGFVDNASDAAKLADDVWREQFARAYFYAIYLFFDIPFPLDTTHGVDEVNASIASVQNTNGTGNGIIFMGADDVEGGYVLFEPTGGSGKIIGSLTPAPWIAPQPISQEAWNASLKTPPPFAVGDGAAAFDAAGILHCVGARFNDAMWSYDVFYTAWDGNAWSSPLNLSMNRGDSGAPRIAVAGDGTVYVVWHDNSVLQNQNNVGQYAIYCRTLSAHLWSGISSFSDSQLVSTSPAIAARGDGVAIVWEDKSRQEICFLERSRDQGWSFPAVTISKNTYHHTVGNPSVAIEGSGAPYAAWADPDVQEIYYTTRTGTSWQEPENISQNPGQCNTPSLVASGSVVALFWKDNTTGNYEIACRVWDGAWGDALNLSQDTANSEGFAVALDSRGIIHLVYESSGRLLYTQGNGALFTTPLIVSGADPAAFPSALAIRPSDTLTLLWSAGDATVQPFLREWPLSSPLQLFEDDPDNSLPVVLSAFSAVSPDGATVVLRWTTETEVHNLRFDVYKNGEKIVSVRGGGTSAVPLQYQFTDPDVEVGETYEYVIEDISFSGERNRSEALTITVTSGARESAYNPKPERFALLQNYPNPFNLETWIPFALSEDAPSITILIHDSGGNLVKRLAIGGARAGFYTAKEHAAYWDGRNDGGEQVASGIYYYTLRAGAFTATRKLIVRK